jgi:hypothetical protein
MSHSPYLVPRLIHREVDSGGFYLFTYRLKERVILLTRSFDYDYSNYLPMTIKKETGNQKNCSLL